MSHATVSQRADDLLSTPRAHLRLELRQDDGGLTLLHEGAVLVECPLTRQGMTAAGFMAQALGVDIPPLGESAVARVSTGVLYRVIAIPRLDFDKEESYILLERLLDEAGMQRGASSGDV